MAGIGKSWGKKITPKSCYIICGQSTPAWWAISCHLRLKDLFPQCIPSPSFSSPNVWWDNAKAARYLLFLVYRLQTHYGSRHTFSSNFFFCTPSRKLQKANGFRWRSRAEKIWKQDQQPRREANGWLRGSWSSCQRMQVKEAGRWLLIEQI